MKNENGFSVPWYVHDLFCTTLSVVLIGDTDRWSFRSSLEKNRKYGHIAGVGWRAEIVYWVGARTTAASDRPKYWSFCTRARNLLPFYDANFLISSSRTDDRRRHRHRRRNTIFSLIFAAAIFSIFFLSFGREKYIGRDRNQRTCDGLKVLDEHVGVTGVMWWGWWCGI